jgi:hypothetical protein
LRSGIADRLDALIAEVRAVRRLLEARQAPRDDRHAALLQAIAGAAGTAAFTAAELIAHAQVEGALRSALMASCGMNARKLGRMLRRLEGAELGGYAIERCGEESAGVIWTVKPRKAMLAIA